MCIVREITTYLLIKQIMIKSNSRTKWPLNTCHAFLALRIRQMNYFSNLSRQMENGGIRNA